jgi:hypothetical protein
VNYPWEPKELLIKKFIIPGFYWDCGRNFIWRWFDPAILQNFRWLSLFYLLLLFAGVVIVTIISFYGGKLTFPLEKTKINMPFLKAHRFPI